MKIKSKTVSYSQYSNYKSCPYRWYLHNVKKHYVDTPSINLTFGTSFHGTLQLWLKVMYEQSAKASDEMDLTLDFKQRFLEQYRKEVVENNNVHFSTKDEIADYYTDGITLLEWIRKKRRKYFTIRDVKLMGIEIPVLTQANKGIDNVLFKGYIDFILKYKKANKYSIYDIKTSVRGWSPWDKKDTVKCNQLLLYKRKYAEQQGISEDDIDVTFFIVKRKPFNSPDYPIPKVQEFKPPSGKVSLNKAEKDFNDFLTDCFDIKGNFLEKTHLKTPGDACRYCPFNNKPDLCNKIN